MPTWTDLSNDNRSAAYELQQHRRWRSCVSRAYYAIYSAVTKELIQRGVTMPKQRQNPRHELVPGLVRLQLCAVAYPRRNQLADAISRLYNLRCDADYVPAVQVDEKESRLALGLMEKAYRCLGA